MTTAIALLLVLCGVTQTPAHAPCTIVRNALILDVHLDGQGPYPMIFDLRAAVHELDPAVAAYIEKQQGAVEGEAPSPEGPFEAQLHIAGTSAGQQAFERRSMTPLLRILGRRVAGRLAGQALGGALAFDFETSRVSYETEAGDPVNSYVLRGVEPDAAGLSVKGQYNGAEIVLAIDTTLGAMLALPQARENAGTDRPLVVGGFPGAGGLRQTLGQELELAETTVKRPLVSIEPGLENARLGLGLLRSHKVVFGLPRAYLRLEPWGDGSIEAPRPAGCGLALVMAMEAGWMIAVAPGTPAAAAGLRAGDVLLAVGEEPLGGKDFAQAQGLLAAPPGSKLRLLMRRGADTAPFEVSVKPLL